MEKSEVDKIVATSVCGGCSGNLVVILQRSPGSQRAEYGLRCVNNCDLASVGIKKLGGILQRYAEGNLSEHDSKRVKEWMEGRITMDEKQPSTTQGTAAEKFTAIVLREFSGLTGTNLGLNNAQRKLAQHLFIKVDLALKSFEAKRKGASVTPYTWQNVNLNKLATDAIYRIDLGLDALIPNHIHPVPYWNDREQKYDMDLRIGYVGKDYYHRLFAIDPPVNVIYELVYDTDKFTPVKSSNGVLYDFQITQPWSRGKVVGGFGYVIYQDPRKNLLVLVSEDDFLKSKKLAKSAEFWENFPVEMRLKTLVHRVTDKIPIDPAKTNKSYVAVEREEEAIEGTYHEIPTEALMSGFDSPVSKVPPPPSKLESPLPKIEQTSPKEPTEQKSSTVPNQRRGRPKKTDSPQSVPPPVEAEKPPQVIPQNLVRDIVKELKDKNYSNDMIKDILQKSTGGKKGGWDNNDAPAIRKFVEELEAKKTESALQQTTDEVEKFLKEQQQ